MKNSFTPVNPNKSLITYGLVLIILNLIVALLHKNELLFGVGFLVRLLVLVWIPKAASIVGRQKWPWTLISIISPSLGMIMLGYAGYRENEYVTQLCAEYTEYYAAKEKELESLVKKGEISAEKMTRELSVYYNVLQADAHNQIQLYYGETPDDELLTTMLREKGYLPDEDSATFVDSGNKCPACGAEVGESDNQCPDCGLALRHSD